MRILERLAANPRVRVHRIPWSVEGRRGEAIGSAYRAALELARPGWAGGDG